MICTTGYVLLLPITVKVPPDEKGSEMVCQAKYDHAVQQTFSMDSNDGEIPFAGLKRKG